MKIHIVQRQLENSIVEQHESECEAEYTLVKDLPNPLKEKCLKVLYRFGEILNAKSIIFGKKLEKTLIEFHNCFESAENMGPELKKMLMETLKLLNWYVGPKYFTILSYSTMLMQLTEEYRCTLCMKKVSTNKPIECGNPDCLSHELAKQCDSKYKKPEETAAEKNPYTKYLESIKKITALKS